MSRQRLSRRRPRPSRALRLLQVLQRGPDGLQGAHAAVQRVKHCGRTHCVTGRPLPLDTDYKDAVAGGDVSEWLRTMVLCAMFRTHAFLPQLRTSWWRCRQSRRCPWRWCGCGREALAFVRNSIATIAHGTPTTGTSEESSVSLSQTMPALTLTATTTTTQQCDAALQPPHENLVKTSAKLPLAQALPSSLRLPPPAARRRCCAAREQQLAAEACAAAHAYRKPVAK